MEVSNRLKIAVMEPVLPDQAAIKLIGCGGVGGIAARYAARFVASLLAQQGGSARLALIDGDAFEPAKASNVSRMFFIDAENKAAALRTELLRFVADSPLTVLAVTEYVTSENVGRLIGENDIIILCVDNHATRHLVNQHCQDLRNVCLISGGNDGIGTDSTGRKTRGTYGNVQIYVRREGQDLTRPLTASHPEIAAPKDKNPVDQSCSELVNSVPQILFTNLAVASAILNAFWLHVCGQLHYGELGLDIADGLMRPLADGPDSRQSTAHCENSSL